MYNMEDEQWCSCGETPRRSAVASQLALSAALYLLILALLPDTEKVRCRRRAISIIISYTVTCTWSIFFSRNQSQNEVKYWHNFSFDTLRHSIKIWIFKFYFPLETSAPIVFLTLPYCGICRRFYQRSYYKACTRHWNDIPTKSRNKKWVKGTKMY